MQRQFGNEKQLLKQRFVDFTILSWMGYDGLLNVAKIEYYNDICFGCEP